MWCELYNFWTRSFSSAHTGTFGTGFHGFWGAMCSRLFNEYSLWVPQLQQQHAYVFTVSCTSMAGGYGGRRCRELHIVQRSVYQDFNMERVMRNNIVYYLGTIKSIWNVIPRHVHFLQHCVFLYRYSVMIGTVIQWDKKCYSVGTKPWIPGNGKSIFKVIH